jgi:hypothetical protein
METVRNFGFISQAFDGDILWFSLRRHLYLRLLLKNNNELERAWKEEAVT